MDLIQLQLLHSVKITQIQMLKDRGYDVADEEQIINMDLNTFVQYINAVINKYMNEGGGKISVRSSLTRLYTTPTRSRNMLVYYGSKSDDKSKISIEIVRAFQDIIIKNRNINEAVLIVNGDLSSPAEDLMNKLKTIKWQIFKDNELTYNPTLHVYTPRHELLSKEEKIKVLQEFKTSISNLPLINLKDPIIKYYGWLPGGLVRIFRNDGSLSVLTPNSIGYRVIVDIN